MADPLHQQAEALAKQIAQRLNNHWADDRSVPDVIALIVPVLQDLRQRVQAETLLNAAEHIARNGSTFYKPGRAEEYLREQAERIARDE